MIDSVSPGRSEGRRGRFSWAPFFTRHYNRFLVGAEITVDLATIFMAIETGYAIFLQYHPSRVNWSHYSLIAAVTSVAGLLIFERLGLYRQQVSLMNLIEIRKIVRAVLVLFLGLLLYSYFMKASYPRTVFVYASALTLLFVIVERMMFFKLQQALHLRGFNVRRVLIIGAGEEGRLLYQNINQAPKLGYFVVGFLDEDQEQLAIARDWFADGRDNGLLFSYNLSDLHDLVSRAQVQEIFVSKPLHGDGDSDLQKLMALCRKENIKLNFIPYLRGYCTSQIEVNDINGIAMISFGPIRISHAEHLSKRIFDLALSLPTLLLLSPVFITIAILIRRDSQGPVFFKQMRVGKDGVLFCMYKFRSMFVGTSQYGNSPRSSQDPRITKIGRFLRKTSLDELPQIFNVIRGEMSLVGPRPEMPFIVENEYTDYLRERLRVKPGITGVWQISGDRTREIHENISYDIFYIENRSLLLDIIILVRTLIFGIMAMKTY